MKKAIYTFCILCLILLWVGPAGAVDKTKKDKTPPPKEKIIKVEKDEKGKSGDQKTDNQTSRRKKTYDNFVDKNNNGIDDRSEKKVSTKKTPKEDSPKTDKPRNP